MGWFTQKTADRNLPSGCGGHSGLGRPEYLTKPTWELEIGIETGSGRAWGTGGAMKA